jgi:membrane protease YdiL (CAAX protease family)
VNLTWTQRLAAYWAISWPASVASVVFAFVHVSFFEINDVIAYGALFGLGADLLFFTIQAALTPRLVRKRFRHFRIAVIRDDRSGERLLAPREALSVWFRIVAPQIALYVALGIFVYWFGEGLHPQAARSLSSLASWLKYLVVGPFGIALALKTDYGSFRLQPLTAESSDP